MQQEEEEERGPEEPKERQSIEGVSRMNGAGDDLGSDGDVTDDVVAPGTTTFRKVERPSTPVDEEDVKDPMSICSIGMDPPQTEAEDSEEMVQVEAAEGGDDLPGPSDQSVVCGERKLRLTLEGLERYFVFGKFVKTESKYDGKYCRQVHTGKAKCSNCGKEYSFTTQSRAHLKTHYDKMHKALVPHLVTAMEGQSKRGRPRPGFLDSSKESDKQVPMEESFHKKDFISDEMLRELCLRWFKEVMLPPSVTDHPATNQLLCALRADFNLPSSTTLYNNMVKLSEKTMGYFINHYGHEEEEEETQEAEDVTTAEPSIKTEPEDSTKQSYEDPPLKELTKVYVKEEVEVKEEPMEVQQEAEEFESSTRRGEKRPLTPSQVPDVPSDIFKKQRHDVEERIEDEPEHDKHRKIMDRYLNRDRSRSGLTEADGVDGWLSSVNFRATTPVSDRDSELDQSQHSDASMSRDTQPLEEPEEVEETGDSGEQDNAEAIRELKGYLQNCQRFYTFSKFLKAEGEGKKVVYTGLAKCMQPGCKNKGVSYTSVSRAHLSGHYQTMHPGKKPALIAALAGNSKRGRPMERSSKKPHLVMEESVRDKFSQDKARQMFTRWFVETLSPLSLCEHPYTRELLAYLSPEFQLMSRTTLRGDLEDLMDKAKMEINNLMLMQKWVATTADTWTADSRAFLGMTVHWIDRLSLKRKKATLACRELKTHQLLREVIHDVHQEFGIARKVAAITTDSGTNYTAAFNDFGESEEKEEEKDEDGEVVLGQPGDVQGQLDSEAIDAKAQTTLPPHCRCSVHTLNLMATTDIKGWSDGNTSWHKATAKARHLWDLQNQIPIAAKQIKDVIKRKLRTPTVVRWNSYFKSVKALLEVMALPEHVEAINNIIIQQSKEKAGEAILEEDIKVLTEYRDVLKPVADTLDSLQGEDTAFMGILLPTLLVLKRWLMQHQQKGDLQYAQPLLHSLLRSFDKRFGSLFEDQDLLMASALHPSFTPAVLAKIVPDQADAIKDRIFRELKTMVRPREEQQATRAQPDVKSHQDMVFKELFGADQVISQDVDQELRDSIEDWKPQREVLSWTLFPKEHREAWIDLFIKYNTPLPRSAAVEKMFCISGDILRPKRAALSSAYFQKLVFLKGNMSLLGFPSYKGQFGEEQ